VSVAPTALVVVMDGYPARKGWGISLDMIPSAVGAALEGLDAEGMAG
jgi:hypothetical protein